MSGGRADAGSDGSRAGGWALAVLVLSVSAVGAAYVSVLLPGPTPAWAPWAAAGGTVVSMLSLMAVGAAREGRIGPLGPVFGVAGLVVGGGFAALLALPAVEAADPVLVLGLPVRAAVLLYGIGLLPTLLIPLAYALTFEQTLTDDDLERVRRGVREGERAPETGRDAGAERGEEA